MTDEQLFTQKARTEVVCFSDQCPLSKHCLRRHLTQYLPDDLRLVTCMNPRYKDVEAGRCGLFVSDQKVQMARGMMEFFDEMPGRMTYQVRNALIDRFSRKIFYAYRKGERLLSPAKQQVIADILKEHGWEKPPRYDGYVMDYCWE